ncbi:Solute carrier family 2, facilitated glucose transporter member 3 [Toxocara canis]|uniref:Solute carrier family 2, facilitated glucose transporter member 3 n=2 Tax=Toxocara canis TaxID=6265 RepID=A0A0B2VPM3_TOXCA|nr:Solute carrier family 2, facilitated glucose transporter member 3 [Toxocara canis]VDM37102.1 unnamed protein product [Toxocara canis]
MQLNPTVKLFLIGCVLSVLTNIPSGFTHTSVNTAMNELNAYLNESFIIRGIYLSHMDLSYLRSAINSCWYAGQIIGSLFSPLITDTYGRKAGYLIATFAMTFACAVQAIAVRMPYPEILIAGRVFASMFSPLSDAVLVLYLQECAPTNLRGQLASLFASGYAAMCLLGMILGINHILGHSLSMLLFVPVIPGCLGMIFLAFLPETPKFLMITKKDRDAAVKSLKYFRGECDASSQIVDEYLCEVPAKDALQRSSVADLFRISHIREALILSFMVLALTLPFYAILQSSTYFFLAINLPHKMAQISSTMMMVVMFVCGLIAPFLIERFPRRSLLIFCGVLTILSLTSFIVCGIIASDYPLMRYGALFSLVGYLIAYGSSIGPVSWFISAELVPQHYRANMFCVCCALHSFFVVLTNFLTLPFFNMFGPISFVPLFVIPAVFAVLYLERYLPETKDREIHDIVDAIKTKRKTVPVYKTTRLSIDA